MVITLTWHLVIMILISIFIIAALFKGSEDIGDFFSSCLGLGILIILWLIYGGIVWW